MSSPLKNYKIIVDSKHFGNMKGISPAEVAKKAAGKILGLSNKKISQFSMIETKNGKIRNYKAFKENLIRPYKKNGKLITCRIIVKKIGKHTGGGESNPLSENIYKKETLSEEDKEKIKATMVISNRRTGKSETYDPYNLTNTIEELVEDLGGGSDLYLDINDPVHHFFEEYNIIVSGDNLDWIDFFWTDTLGEKGRRNIEYKVSYEFTNGDENFFNLIIYNLDNAKDTKEFKKSCKKYVNFLKKIYLGAEIGIRYYSSYGSNGSGSGSNN